MLHLTSVVKSAFRSIDTLIPPDLSPEDRRRHELLFVIQRLLLAASSVGLVMKGATGARLSFMPAFVVVTMLLVPVVLRRSGRIDAAANTLVGGFLLTMVVWNIGAGGTMIEPQMATTVFPLLAIPLLGIQGTVPWMLLAWGHLLVGVLFQAMGVHPLVDIAPREVTIGPVVMTMVVFGIASWYEWSRRGALEAMAQALASAERSEATKAAMLSTLSHELRTPMNGVLGALEILHNEGLGPDKGRWVRVGRESALHMLTLLGDILDVSRLDADRLMLEEVPVDLQVLARNVIELQQADRRYRGLDLRLRVDGEPRIIGDPVRIRQILFNLVNNAVKFTESGHVEVRLTLSSGEPRQVKIEVEDTGIGMEQQHLEGLFDAFTQADVSTTRRYGGSGLGLHITRALVERMGGTITVSSQVGVGSLFVAVFAARSWESAIAEDEVVAQRPQLGLHVLLVEDDPVNRLVLVQMLQALGCQTTCARHGGEAEAAVQKGSFDLVLMDCEMPTMDGFEATTRLRAAGVELPILALTAHASKERREQCLAVGMDDMLSKPVTLDLVQEFLQRWS